MSWCCCYPDTRAVNDTSRNTTILGEGPNWGLLLVDSGRFGLQRSSKPPVIPRSPVDSCSCYPDSGQTPPGLQLKVRGPCDLGILWLVPTHTIGTNSVFIGDSWSVILNNPPYRHPTNKQHLTDLNLTSNLQLNCKTKSDICRNQSMNHGMVVVEMADILYIYLISTSATTHFNPHNMYLWMCPFS